MLSNDLPCIDEAFHAPGCIGRAGGGKIYGGEWLHPGDMAIKKGFGFFPVTVNGFDVGFRYEAADIIDEDILDGAVGRALYFAALYDIPKGNMMRFQKKYFFFNGLRTWRLIERCQ